MLVRILVLLLSLFVLASVSALWFVLFFFGPSCVPPITAISPDSFVVADVYNLPFHAHWKTLVETTL